MGEVTCVAEVAAVRLVNTAAVKQYDGLRHWLNVDFTATSLK